MEISSAYFRGQIQGQCGWSESETGDEVGAVGRLLLFSCSVVSDSL